ncbi:MAG: hypothetical protein AAF757_00090 [Cyanobacteria bacterium P01_D01_bin.116]
MKQIIKFINQATKSFLQKRKQYKHFQIRSLPPYHLILIIPASLIAIVWFIWKDPQWQVKNIKNIKDRITVENAIRGNLIQAAGGILLVGTGSFSWKSY